MKEELCRDLSRQRFSANIMSQAMIEESAILAITQENHFHSYDSLRRHSIDEFARGEQARDFDDQVSLHEDL